MSVGVLLLCTMTASGKQAEFGQVTGADVNIREMPSQDSTKLKQLAIGEEVEILGEEDGWYHVEYQGTSGYIRNDLVFVRSLSDRIAYANKDGINLRGGPGESAYIIGQLTAGMPLRVKQMVGEWCYVVYEGQTGFVHRDLLYLSKQGSDGYEQLLKRDMKGSEVKRLQEELARRNFLLEKHVTGEYGSITQDAVKQFQKAADLTDDGVAGPTTIQAIYDKSNNIRKAPAVPKTTADFKGIVQTIDWWKGGNKVLKRPGGTATVYDIKSGQSFRVRRTGGTNHIDGTPMTAADTAIFKKLLGGRWSHDKRPILLIVGSKVYAASIYCMPHGGDVQKNDNFPGMLCIHFTNSRTHGGNRVDPLHKSNIQYAYNKYK